jgi:hypothetical protein
MLILILILSTAQIAFANIGRCSNNDKRFRIGVLYQSSDARKRLLDGVEAALGQYKPKNTAVCITNLPYTGPSVGLAKLRGSITTESVDLIIGPTESDIFVRAYDERASLGAHKIPVISPLVTADVEIDTTDWFFRTNVGIGRRADVMFDYLNKYWLKTFAVLYADTEFGRRAEDAFHAEVDREIGDTYSYLSESYKPPPRVRSALSRVIDFRPEAVGIFGEREDIPVIMRELETMIQASPPYKPVLFTLIDISQIREEANDMRFVAATRSEFLPTKDNEQSDYDDVKGLAFDTMAYVVYCLDKLPPFKNFSSRRAYRERFRSEFSAVMNGGSKVADLSTGMKFLRYTNKGSLKIYHISDGQIKKLAIRDELPASAILVKKINLIKSRFGFYPLLSLLVLLIVIVVNATWDLIRWYEGKWWKVFTYPRTYVLFGIQYALGFMAFLYLAETGRIRYDSLAVATVIGFAPSQFLRLKLFETRFGSTVGIVSFYDKVLSHLNEGLMVAKYKDLQTKIEFLAYYNSKPGMESELKRIFSHHRNSTQKQRLNEGLVNQLKNEPDPWERKMICARELMRRLSWDELKDHRLLPKDLKEDDDLQGPFNMIRESRQYVLSVANGIQTLDKVLSDELSHCSQRVNNHYENIVKESEGESDIAFSKISFLVLSLSYNEDRLRDQGLLPTP